VRTSIGLLLAKPDCALPLEGEKGRLHKDCKPVHTKVSTGLPAPPMLGPIAAYRIRYARFQVGALRLRPGELQVEWLRQDCAVRSARGRRGVLRTHGAATAERRSAARDQLRPVRVGRLAPQERAHALATPHGR
jgi:hypothetical protein